VGSDESPADRGRRLRLATVPRQRGLIFGSNKK
jgi:hypothetical protein